MTQTTRRTVTRTTVRRPAAGKGTRKTEARRRREQRDARIVAAYTSGRTLSDIGNELGLTRERVRQILAANGVSSRSPEEVNAIRDGLLLERHGNRLHAEFDRVGTVNGVVAHFRGKVPARLVREALAGRASEVRLVPRKAPKSFTDREILRAVKAADANGATSCIAYRQWRSSTGRDVPSLAAIQFRFGTWNAAREAAGLEVTTLAGYAGFGATRFSDKDLHAALDGFLAHCKEHSLVPTARAYDDWSRAREGTPLLPTLRYRLGRSWNTLINEHRGLA